MVKLFVFTWCCTELLMAKYELFGGGIRGNFTFLIVSLRGEMHKKLTFFGYIKKTYTKNDFLCE